jgi:hypothetical protein
MNPFHLVWKVLLGMKRAKEMPLQTVVIDVTDVGKKDAGKSKNIKHKPKWKHSFF